MYKWFQPPEHHMTLTGHTSTVKKIKRKNKKPEIFSKAILKSWPKLSRYPRSLILATAEHSNLSGNKLRTAFSNMHPFPYPPPPSFHHLALRHCYPFGNLILSWLAGPSCVLAAAMTTTTLWQEKTGESFCSREYIKDSNHSSIFTHHKKGSPYWIFLIVWRQSTK